MSALSRLEISVAVIRRVFADDKTTSNLYMKINDEYNNSNTSPESTLERTGNPMETKQLEIVATQLLSLKADIEVGFTLTGPGFFKPKI